ncbi:hypothetical protein [Gilvimarinus sp. 1_MG-2023]|uniref:hypothetical protein n=1 Tax=Gilvimarinus sp. 1_MG-2023 TaxID=3062638 RepID=UPI0026E1A30E|nr:hypothetical protein [Gilvimarinus sp. 1_MG-2023]MDO6747082.1 hypothetical protein [Gilvimarinus sp. 1_MG-2023]
MKRFIKLTILASLAALLAGCFSSVPSELKSSVGETYYTQRNLWIYRSEHETVNYAVERLLPINSEIKVRDIGGKVVEFTLLDDGADLVLINIEKYTQAGMSEIFDRYFAKSKVSLSSFSAAEREAIEAGDVREGMSKAAVLLARGYPPAHETHSVENDEWKYWRNRFNTRVVHFDNGRVDRIVD